MRDKTERAFWVVVVAIVVAILVWSYAENQAYSKGLGRYEYQINNCYEDDQSGLYTCKGRPPR